jgi:chromosomal replication initiator protein
MIAKIQSAVISYYGIDEQELFGTRRATARPRQVAIYLTRQLTRYSLPQIGIRFDKDHTTVLHAVQKIKALLPEDDKLAADVEALTESLER